MQASKLWLHVNGVNRMTIVDKEKDTLATVLRRLGCTSVKVGCGIGVCGTCTVILNGKLVRSCTKKIKSVEDYSDIVTVEGIGTPQHLHPIQQSWMFHGGVQCGFCTPGFIVSSYALLQENINPTREEVRAWFKKNRNICRCTGYVQLVDAVMDAAAVMRGEKTMEDISFKEPEDGEYYGKGIQRPDALAKVCGLCDYGQDISEKMPEGTLHLALVQPRKAFHAKILNIDYSKAMEMPGVVRVITAADVKGTNNLGGPSGHPRSTQDSVVQPVICSDTIYKYGDVVAVVAADTREHARAAAAAVEVELEQLPEYHSYLEAVAPGSMPIQGTSPNMYAVQPIFKGDWENVEDIIEDSAYSVSGSFYSSREPHLSLEGNILQAYIGEDGMVTIHGKPQAIGEIRETMSAAVGIPADNIRVILNPVGGTFGWGMSADPFAIMAVAVTTLDNPCSLEMSYEEHQHYSGKRCPSNNNVTMACDENGKITALKYDAGIDTGPYPSFAEGILMQRLPMFMGFHYVVPNIEGITRAAVSNHAHITTYRGYGSPQAYSGSEAIVDMLARKAGIDPLEFRKINVAHPGDIAPYMHEYTEITSAKLLDMMEPRYKEAKKRAAELDTPEVRRGVGICLGGYTCTGGSVDAAGSRLELEPDGSVSVFNTWEEMGQGGEVGSVMIVMEALKPLHLKPSQVNIRTNDSKTCPDSGPAAGSRSHVMNSHATVAAANKMLAAMKKDDGTYRTYDEMVAEGLPTKFEGSWANAVLEDLSMLDPNTGKGNPIPHFMYACFMAEVAVEVATGKVTVTAFDAAVDIGTPGNIDAVLGQGYGGISHAIGFALSEDYSDVKKHANIMGAGVPDISMIPDNMNIQFLESPRKNVEFNSVGCSEMFQSSDHVAVLNAIQDACGVRIYEIPATKDKVLAGLREIEEFGEQKTPEPYYMGSEFEDEVENIVANPKEIGSGPAIVV